MIRIVFFSLFVYFCFYFVRVCDKNLQMSTKIARFALKKNSQKGPKRRLRETEEWGNTKDPKHANQLKLFYIREQTTRLP